MQKLPLGFSRFTRLRLHSFRIRVFFVEFDTLHREIFVICWIESVDPIDDLCMTNQIYLFIVMSQYTNSHAETPFGFFSIYAVAAS